MEGEEREEVTGGSAEMKNSFVVLTVLCAASALAMPTKEELGKAQSLVVELMADDLAELRAGKKTAVQIAETEIDYAEKADTDAAKYILYGNAVEHFAAGGEYDRAASALDDMAGLDKVLDDDLLGVASKALKKAKKGEGGALKAMLSELQNRKRALDNVKKLRILLRKDPENSTVRTRLAEAHVAAGEWDKALDEFARIVDDVGKVAKWELKKEEGAFDACKVGDFWWKYAEKKKGDAAIPYRKHAAKWYQEAVTSNLVTGLRKELVERKLAEAAAVVAEKPTQASHLTSGDGKQGRGITLKIKNGVDIEFVHCPAGKFRMGWSGDDTLGSPAQSHAVTITRPFWMAKFPITRAQWSGSGETYRGGIYPERLDISKTPVARVPYDRVSLVCERLTKKYAAKIPKGYVLRLPTEAEWEYALWAQADSQDPYIRFRDGEREVREGLRRKIMITQDDVKEFVPNAEKVGRERGGFNKLLCPVGLKQPNRWGLYDMMSNGIEMTLDVIACSRARDGNRIPPVEMRNGVIQYDAEEVDPLRFSEDPLRETICRGGGKVNGAMSAQEGSCFCKCRYHCCEEWFHEMTFRLVIGPDLVSEWKAKNAKK